jgi:hypothetical protein
MSRPGSIRTATDLAILLGAFAVASVAAEVLGAANLGTAMTFGQIGFAGALVWVLLRRPGVPPPAARPRTPPPARSAGTHSGA